MKQFLIALKDNLSNIFSLVGIGLTVYFAVFYVPNYVKEIEIKKIESTHKSLVESIQELVYNNHTIDGDDIDTLIRGKELSGQLEYPFTSEELLIQVQDRFLENKFIPLDQRKSLIEKIDKIRETLSIPVTTNNPKEDSKTNIASIYSLVSIVLGILAGVSGLFSVWSRNLKLEEIKIESSIEDRKESIQKNVHTSILMENEIYETLKIALGPNNVEFCPPSTPADFIIKMEGCNDIAVEVKYTETGLIPLRVINMLIQAVYELEMPLVLISNADITVNAYKKLSEFNNKNKNTPISFINIDNSKDIQSDIRKLFN